MESYLSFRYFSLKEYLKGLKKSFANLVVLLLLLTNFIYIPVGVSAGFDTWEQIVSSGKDKDVIDIGNELMAAGFNYNATIGLLTNINSESSFDISAEEDLVTASTHNQGQGWGLIQWTGDRRTAVENYIREKHGGKNSLAAQVDFLLYEMQTSHKGNMSSSYTAGQLSTYGLSLKGKGVNSWEDFMNIDNHQDAAALFMACMEIPGIPHWEQRTAMADILYKELEGKLDGSTKGGTSSEESSMIELQGVGDMSADLTDEWDLKGMSKRTYLSSSQSERIETPDGSDLTAKERYNIAVIRKEVTGNENASMIYNLRVLFTMLGFVGLIYCVTLVISFVFDANNTILELSLVEFLTVGKAYYYTNMSYEEKLRTRKTVVAYGLTVMAISVLTISGSVYGVLDVVVDTLGELFSIF